MIKVRRGLTCRPDCLAGADSIYDNRSLRSSIWRRKLRQVNLGIRNHKVTGYDFVVQVMTFTISLRIHLASRASGDRRKRIRGRLCGLPFTRRALGHPVIAESCLAWDSFPLDATGLYHGRAAHRAGS